MVNNVRSLADSCTLSLNSYIYIYIYRMATHHPWPTIVVSISMFCHIWIQWNHFQLYPSMNTDQNRPTTGSFCAEGKEVADTAFKCSRCNRACAAKIIYIYIYISLSLILNTNYQVKYTAHSLWLTGGLWEWCVSISILTLHEVKKMSFSLSIPNPVSGNFIFVVKFLNLCIPCICFLKLCKKEIDEDSYVALIVSMQYLFSVQILIRTSITWIYMMLFNNVSQCIY